MNGKVRFFNKNKGFGFIENEKGEDFFFHVSFMKNQREQPIEEDQVEFEPSENEKGKIAKNITITEETRGET